ncbi:hypothetical protein F5Y19DRAFT_492161 [Xylariaceae sp. FL1651]|nr:hypothetical protein F5Y19DRAFT_492161 [Xylariaceae sp. FL1651]
MLRGLLLGAAVYGGLASAYTGTSISTASKAECSTAYGSGAVAPAPILTSGTVKTISSLVTLPATTVPSGYTKITVDPVTTTQHTQTSTVITVLTKTLPAATSVQMHSTTIATATWPVTTCTNGVVPTTVTKYTGTYTPVPGQETALPETSGLSTIISTPTVVVQQPITTVTSTAYLATVTVYQTTISSTITSYMETGHAVPTRIACGPTVTTTLDARCAPTNLVSSINNIGLVSGQYAANTSVVYTRDEPWGTDPSLCCQLCLDNAGCGASMWGPYDTCGLYYVGSASAEPQCDFVLTYGTEDDVYAGQGIIVQNGCGVVEYEA